MTSLTNALPLIQGPSNQICFLLEEYMRKVHPWMIQIFGDAAYAYIKDDIASIQRPGIFIYPLNAGKNSFSSQYNGKIIFELHFSLQEQRVSLAKNVIQIAEDIMLINMNQEFMQYLQRFMPGLFWFGKEARVDYSRVYAKECVVKMEFDFRVELIAYQNELQAQGKDINSPDQQIYAPALALRECIALMNNPPKVALVTGGFNGELEVDANNIISNLAVESDNSVVLGVQTV